MGKIRGQNVLQHAMTEVKKKIKKNELKSIIKISNKDEVNEKPKYSLEKEDKERGFIYLGHIPHGFYEKQIKKYFQQFGTVLQVRVARSKRSGRSKGFAYIHFKDIAVAKIAAEAMNNYLMSGRLLKASYIPKEKQDIFLFFGQNYHQQNYPRLHNVRKTLLSNQKIIKKPVVKKRNNITKKKLLDLEELLKSKGVNLELLKVKKSVIKNAKDDTLPQCK